MSDIHNFGKMNGHAVGIIMKEAVRRAIAAIRRERLTFEMNAKAGHDGAMDVMVTSADRAAQAMYVKMLRECFPSYGIVAEEDGLTVPCTAQGRRVFFTVDPLDGTKAFGRKQSHGVGTMIALIDDGRVAAAFVGDVNTQEIYGYCPSSTRVDRIYDQYFADTLIIDSMRPLARNHVLLYQDRDAYDSVLQKLLNSRAKSFGGIQIVSSITAIEIARIWKSEIGALIMVKGRRSPRFLCPIVGISKLLGFVFLRCEEDALVPYEPVISDRVYSVDFDTLVVHRSRLDELNGALRCAIG